MHKRTESGEKYWWDVLMIKTKFVFAVSLVAILAVGSAWANAPATEEDLGTVHTVYTDRTPTSGAGIAGVSYVNNAVNNAGKSAQAAEAHAAAAGQHALDAATSAAEAKTSAQSANDALVNKADKSALDAYATVEYVNAQLTSVSTETGNLKSVDEQLRGDLDDLTEAVGDKQAKSTAEYQMGNASGGWTAMTDAQKNALNSGVTSATKVTHTANTAAGTTTRPVYVTSGGVVTAVTGMSIPDGAESNPKSWATIWVE
ncbi:MAG: hypothetical protein IIV74_01695 [Alphaproteobacteria bacterium]|nr:hypothetical protein [Alphaproteobacteria bacterium]